MWSDHLGGFLCSQEVGFSSRPLLGQACPSCCSCVVLFHFCFGEKGPLNCVNLRLYKTWTHPGPDTARRRLVTCGRAGRRNSRGRQSRGQGQKLPEASFIFKWVSLEPHCWSAGSGLEVPGGSEKRSLC